MMRKSDVIISVVDMVFIGRMIVKGMSVVVKSRFLWKDGLWWSVL